jgi:hypothetical protein
MIAFGLWILSTTVAHADTFAGLSGVFVPTTSYEQIMTERNASVERSLEASNFIVRTVAASSLETQPTMCSKYKFAYDKSTLFVQCDDHPNIPVYLDGRPTQYPKKDGTYIDVIAKVKNNTITQVFPFTNGTLTVIYKYDQGQFWVQKSIESPYLGLPVVAEGTYNAQ